jgi:opacity protein-like surface antigen
MAFLLTTSSARAEDLKGKWYLGGNISFLSTFDDIRSNSNVIIGNFGDDGIPFTGDPNEDQGCLDQSVESNSPFCDPRPDDLLSRESAIEETFRFEVTAGYGMTSWLSLQFDASYFEGDVGPIDTFVRQPFLGSNLPNNPPGFVGLEERTIPIQAGTITEIPVSLSGVIRFRKDSPLNPYVMIGAGMLFAEMDVSGDVGDLNARLDAARIRFARNEYNETLTPPEFQGENVDGTVPLLWPVNVNVEDAFEWHLGAGAEYFFNERFSMIFDARYMFANQSVNITLGGEDQVDYIIYSENYFRNDGSLKFFVNTAEAPNTACSDAVSRNADGSIAVDPNGIALDFGKGCSPRGDDAPGARVDCDSTAAGGSPGDFDNSGSIAFDPDVCYKKNLYQADGAGADRPDGIFVVQGGKIDLDGRVLLQ